MGAQGKIPHANSSTHSCFAKSSGISAGPYRLWDMGFGSRQGKRFIFTTSRPSSGLTPPSYAVDYGGHGVRSKLSSECHKFRSQECLKLYLLSPLCKLDVRGSLHHSTIHKEKFNKMQQCIRILLFHMYMKLNMFRATHRPSSGA
jgi:hypothetical protein